jgi:AraC-like DNA-binding protein
VPIDTRPVPRDLRVSRTLFQLLDGNARKASPLAADEALCMVLGHLLTGRTSPETVCPVFVRRARQRIDDMPAEAMSLAALSAACGTSRFHLLRSFARVTGLTPHAYRIQRRIDLARSLIRDGACASGPGSASWPRWRSLVPACSPCPARVRTRMRATASCGSVRR